MSDSKIAKLEEQATDHKAMLELQRKQIDSIVDLLGEFEISLKKATADMKATLNAFVGARKEIEDGAKRLGIELRASLASMEKRSVKIEADVKKIRILLRQSPEE